MRSLKLTASLLFLVLAFVTLGQVQSPPFENEIVRFEEQDRISPPAPGEILFIGSSSIRLWKSLAEDFPEYKTLNRGFGGSRIPDSVRNVDRIVIPYKPKAIVFYAGTNDLASGDSPETVLKNYDEFVSKVRAKLPGVPIAFISLAPAPSRWKNADNIRKANALIKRYSSTHRRLYYIDIFPLMLDAQGNPRPELFVADQLHMKPEGYAIWTKAVDPVLHRMLR